MSEQEHGREPTRGQDRIRELETTVAELQSTVKGLTEELVETKDRLRTLEAELDVTAAEGADAGGPVGVEATPDGGTEKTEANMADDAESSDDEEHIDDIIVA